MRRFRPVDREALLRWHADPAYSRHLGDGSPTTDPADTDGALARWSAHWDAHGFGLAAGELRATGLIVVRGGVQYHRAWPADPELGWAVDPRLWGRGLATEFGAGWLRWAAERMGSPRLVSIATEANVASRRVIEKLGFSLLTTVSDPANGQELWVHRRSTPLD